MFNIEKYPMQEIEKIDLQSQPKIIETKEATFEAKTVIIATGAQAKKLGITGEKEFIGRGVSYCAVCDGAFYRNKDISVLGNGKYAISEANELINIAKSITIITDGKEIQGSVAILSCSWFAMKMR